MDIATELRSISDLAERVSLAAEHSPLAVFGDELSKIVDADVQRVYQFLRSLEALFNQGYGTTESGEDSSFSTRPSPLGGVRVKDSGAPDPRSDWIDFQFDSE